jgi:hypothetical protein
MIDKAVDTTLRDQLDTIRGTHVTVNPSIEMKDPAIMVKLSPMLISAQIDTEN